MAGRNRPLWGSHCEAHLIFPVLTDQRFCGAPGMLLATRIAWRKLLQEFLETPTEWQMPRQECGK